MIFNLLPSLDIGYLVQNKFWESLSITCFRYLTDLGQKFHRESIEYIYATFGYEFKFGKCEFHLNKFLASL